MRTRCAPPAGASRLRRGSRRRLGREREAVDPHAQVRDDPAGPAGPAFDLRVRADPPVVERGVEIGYAACAGEVPAPRRDEPGGRRPRQAAVGPGPRSQRPMPPETSARHDTRRSLTSTSSTPAPVRRA